jgi:para-nitrobenzyl esterase
MKKKCELERTPFAVWVVMTAVLLLVLPAAVASAQDDSLVVQTAGGQVRGVARSDGGAKFFGIPFAEPPVGELRGTITKMSGEFAPQVLKAYGLADGGTGTSDPLFGSAADQFSADSMFRCPATAEARWHTAAHHRAYEYEFDHAVPGQPAAVHSTELGYVFGFYPKAGNLAGPYSDADSKIAEMVENYFTNFAKTGNPNGPGVPNWPEFGSAATYVQITQDGQITTAGDLRGPVCKLYRDVVEARVKQGK